MSISIYSFGQAGDSITPVRKLNKTFQVVAHIIYDEDSTTLADLNIISGVNTFFSAIGVSFNLCDTNYIYNYQYYNDVTDEDRANLLAEYWVPSRINIFFVGSVSGGFCGNADLGGIASTRQVGIVLGTTGTCGDRITLAHELGHFFGLPHTFETSNGGPELVDGSNCSTAGDGICDTPADPYVFLDNTNDYVFRTPNDCVFKSQKKDANGQYYNPDVCNIMSYYFCGSKFTQGQYEKMVDVYFSNPVHW